MAGPSELIELRKRWVGAQVMARSLGIDRTTLWKREGDPATAPADFWPSYAHALRSAISPQAQDALKALDVVAGAMAGAAS